MESKQGTSQKITVLGGRSELNPNARMGNGPEGRGSAGISLFDARPGHETSGQVITE